MQAEEPLHLPEEQLVVSDGDGVEGSGAPACDAQQPHALRQAAARDHVENKEATSTEGVELLHAAYKHTRW